jgi:hypothetical protein
LPGKKIDGRDVRGFAVKVFGLDWTVWADAKTHLPVRMETRGKNEEEKGVEVDIEIVHDEFVFDKELDPALFSLEPPAGYKLTALGTDKLPDAPSDPALRSPVITPLVGIGPVKFGMSRQDVERLFGKPDSVERASLNYGSRGFFIQVGKTQGVAIISCASQETFATKIRDFGGKTDKGIALGAHLADIERVYGSPDQKRNNGGSTYLHYNKLRADFTLFGDKLVEMMFQRPPPP